MATSSGTPEPSTPGGDWRSVSGRPGALLFYRRTSPRALLPQNPLAAVTLRDPPFEVSGMTTVVLDRTGRLLSFEAVPPQKDSSPQTATPDWAGSLQACRSRSGDVPRYRPGMAATRAG